MRPRSAAIDAGDTDPNTIQRDETDVDDDTLVNVLMPWDVKTWPRILPLANGVVDIGAYEQTLECPGDVDQDGKVELPDLAIMLACFGSTHCYDAAGCCRADLDNDAAEAVNLTDLAILLTNFGTNCALPWLPLIAPPGGGDGMMSGPSSDDEALRDWLQSATIEEIMEWFHNGMRPVGGNEY